jgi:4-amino-4-deoxy-L-arabinose transferase-like glycosyltransferase
VFVITALALLPDLGGQYVWSKDEARDGLVARDMVERGHRLIPHIAGRVYPYKPPLFHWLVALLSPQGVTEWSLRLPSVLAGAATVAVTYAMGARLATPAAGLVAAATLASSFAFVEWARTGRLEMRSSCGSPWDSRAPCAGSTRESDGTSSFSVSPSGSAV